MSVEKDVLYADRARYFPWRPRLWMAAYDILMYSAVAQVRAHGWPCMLCSNSTAVRVQL